MKYFVYIIQNTAGKIYIGQTYNLEKRMNEHNRAGKGYTAKFRPWRLIYSECVRSRKEAMAKERYFKSGVGRDWIKKFCALSSVAERPVYTG